MKKSKILLPIFTTFGLTATIVPVLTSCDKTVKIGAPDVSCTDMLKKVKLRYGETCPYHFKLASALPTGITLKQVDISFKDSSKPQWIFLTEKSKHPTISKENTLTLYFSAQKLSSGTPSSNTVKVHFVFTNGKQDETKYCDGFFFDYNND